MRARTFSSTTAGTGLCFVVAAVVVMSLTGTAFAQGPQPGLANGFEIDGNLLSNTPLGVGPGNDWLDGPAGPGVGALNPDGTPRDPLTGIHIIDLIRNDDLNVFGSSNKVFHDPNTYGWKAGSAPQKDDMENGLVDFTTDASGHRWISVAGDRRAVTGDSYIDFEFLQTPLYMKSDGGFETAGPDGGRTVGDFLLTIKLSKGGSQAEFMAQRWESDGAGGFTYVDVPIPPGMAFVAANIDSVVATTFDAFGGNQYSINQFGEAAINLSALLPTFDECFGIATVFVRTKSSTSADAELKDFLEPIQVNICLDAEVPVLDCPADITVSCDQSYDPGVIGYSTATDNCTQDPAVTYVDSMAAGACAGRATIYRKWTATDDCGNSTSCTQVITLVDDTAPSIVSAPADVTVECGDDVPAPDTGLITATDACGTVTVTHTGDVSDGGSCPEVITRTYRVADDCGNSVDHVQKITVDDTTPPEATGPDDVTVECIGDVPAPDTTLVSASDNCSTPTVAHAGDVSDGGSCPEVITRTYRVADACGNTTDVVQKITVDDTTAPDVTGPADATVSCIGDLPEPDTTLVSASDNCSRAVVAWEGDESDGGSCPEVITRTYSATDACGNTAYVTQTFTVNDTIPPTADGPDDITVTCIGDVPDPDTTLVSASDNCGGAAVTFVGDSSDGQSCPETITRTYRAADRCGNTVDVVQTITVYDDVDPVAVAPRDTTVQCDADVPAPDVGAVQASDNCSAVTVVHVRDDTDGGSCPEVITRVYRVEDACGNTTECTQRITIDDDIAPVITSGPSDARIQCEADIPAPDPLQIFAGDNCGEPRVYFVGDSSDGQSCPETITRTYRAEDDCGNTTDYVQTITIHDDTPPTLTAPEDRTLECPDSWSFDAPVATDNCDASPLVVVTDEGVEFGPEPWIMRVMCAWQAFDACNNASEKCMQTITLHCEPVSIATFTQGFYGNYGGYFNGVGTIEIIRSLLDDPLVVGKPGRSVSISRPAADCIVARLPSGGTPATLPDIGDASLNWKSCQTGVPLPVDDNGKFVNVLLGQTITLTLNTRYNWPLLLFPLQAKFCTQDVLPGPDHLYGTDDDVLDPDASPLPWEMPPSVLDALGSMGLPANVWGLLELANFALAAHNTYGASLSAINNAVDTINNAFNECRAVVDCNDAAKSGDRGIISLTGTGEGMALERVPTVFELGQNYPNPFNPTTRVRIALPEPAAWSLSIYNVSGQLVRRFEGEVTAPKFVDVLWDGTGDHGRPMASGVYFYRVIAGRHTAVRKMVLLK